MINRPKAFVAFDFDGVIADSRRIAIEKINEIASSSFPRLPKVSSQEDLAILFSGPLKTSLRRFGLTDEQSARFFDMHSAEMRKQSHRVKVFPEVLMCLNAFPRDRLAVVTSAYSDAVQRIISAATGLDQFKGLKIYGRELRLEKSKKFQLISDDFGVDKGQIIKIGDMVSDILYSREFGVRIGVTGWGYHPLDYLRVFQPDFEFRTPDDLALFLQTLK